MPWVQELELKLTAGWNSHSHLDLSREWRRKVREGDVEEEQREDDDSKHRDLNFQPYQDSHLLFPPYSHHLAQHLLSQPKPFPEYLYWHNLRLEVVQIKSLGLVVSLEELRRRGFGLTIHALSQDESKIQAEKQGELPPLVPVQVRSALKV
ncbi:hypothetical protein CVT26_010416 [Gymnopilus dilepis]|uniref:Uncharacterized protein n=1 Tax=Gymnopilus dilepis TaxID=231916 RepID=A0A409W4T7_9AGAR|nr:hypothetical protein CVT26_010416 [Gymnopilus dilepis]